MKNPPRPRRQPRQQPQPEDTRSGEATPAAGRTPSARPQPGTGARPQPGDTARSQAGASPAAASSRERSRRDRYAGQGAQMAREARERKVRSEQERNAELASEQRRSRRAEHGQAIRRMRAPIGAGDAADILGPRDEAPQEAHVERIEERIRARKRLTAVHILGAVGAVVVAVGLVWVLFFSTLFALDVNRIEIASNDASVPVDAVHAQVSPFAGIPLTRLSTSEVEQSVESISQVKDAQVTKVWPNGVHVAFTVRAAAMVAQVNGSLVALDEEGVELGPVAQRPSGAPLVVLPEDEARRGEYARGVLAAWRALSEDLRAQVETMTVSNHQMSVALKDGRQVRWGTLNDEELKAKVLKVLLTQREAKIYDVSSPTSPVTSG